MHTHDVSADAKSSEMLLKLVTEDIQWSQEMFLLFIIAICTDNSGDAWKVQRLLLMLMPWLIIIVCWVHQINLIVGDLLGFWIDFVSCVLKVIKWMNNHSCALGIFCREQLQTFNKILSLILPVITWWTAHYLSLTSWHWSTHESKLVEVCWANDCLCWAKSRCTREGVCKGNLTIKHNTQILARGIQSILDKYNTAEGCISCKGDPKRKL